MNLDEFGWIWMNSVQIPSNTLTIPNHNLISLTTIPLPLSWKIVLKTISDPLHLRIKGALIGDVGGGRRLLAFLLRPLKTVYIVAVLWEILSNIDSWVTNHILVYAYDIIMIMHTECCSFSLHDCPSVLCGETARRWNKGPWFCCKCRTM